MLNIELVYAEEDARTAQLRSDLRDALHMLDLPPRWTEYEDEDERPAYMASVEGPAVYVEGRPVRGLDGTGSGRARIMLVLQELLSRR